MASYHMTNLLPPPQSIPNIEIVFDSNGIYFAGKIVSGRVICTFYNDPICLNVGIECLGLGRVAKRPGDECESPSLSCEEYFNKSFYLFPTGGEPKNVMRGKHIYLFTFQLPEEIPSSFEGSYGYIRYYLKANILTRQEQGVFKPVGSRNDKFTVITNITLPSSVDEPIEKEDADNFGCLWCRWLLVCCLCQIPVDGLVTASCRILKGGYVHGENMVWDGKIHNLSNWKNQAIVKFIQHIKYETPDKPREEKRTLFKWNREDIDETNSEINLTIPVHATAPSPFPFTKLITIDYYVKFVVETVVTLKLPVLIGTGPVRHEVSFQADPSAITPTAPPLHLVPNPLNPPNPNEKPAKSSLDDPPSYEAATGLNSEPNDPSELKPLESLESTNQNPYSYGVIASQPSSSDAELRYTSMTTSSPWNPDPTNYTIKTSIPYSYTPLADKE